MLHRALRLMRTYHQLSQTEFASHLGVSNSYLSEIEAGVKAPSISLLESYAHFFKMPVSSILLFSESIEAPRKTSTKLRVAAADKILSLLEWIDRKDDVQKQ
jgi:transcriptional regulator with XRE-family HTH domain